MAPPGTKYEFLHEVAPGRAAAGDAAPAASPVYVSAYARNGIELLPGIETCYDIWRSAVEQFPTRDALAWRPALGDGKFAPYEYMTYAQAGADAEAAAAALAGLGLAGGGRVGICAPNSPEWMISMQGCNRMGYVAVPLYDTLGDEAVAYIVEHAEVRAVLCSGPKLGEVAKAAAMLEGRGAGGRLLAVAFWGDADPAALAALQQAVPSVMPWRAFLAAGRAAPVPPSPPKPDDLCTIMYTSGTTGSPKGVMLTHRTVASEVAANRQFFLRTAGEPRTSSAMRRYFSFLTLAHIFDRVVEETIVLYGGCIGYFSGDVRKIMDDAAAFQPTGFAGVPRVFDRVYAGAMAKVKQASPLRQLIFRLAFAYKAWRVRGGAKPDLATPLVDAIVFSKFKAAMGGKVEAIMSGGAPLAPRVQEFMQVAMCCAVMQGYGLTESCAASFVTVPWDARQAGTVGPPVPGIEVRLEAVPEMGYTPDGPGPARGEVCLRGPALFKGYYKQPELTAEAVDADGFFHTGDIGEFTPHGFLRIVDRKKNIFKLSQGEYIAVEAIEAALSRCRLVEQIWVYGNSFESCLVAVVVPARDQLEAWAAAGPEGVAAGASYEDLCASPAARAHVAAALVATGRAAKLKGFELPKAVHLDSVMFSVEAGTMTPKMSLVRPKLQAAYKKEIEAMYAELRKAGGN